MNDTVKKIARCLAADQAKRHYGIDRGPDEAWEARTDYHRKERLAEATAIYTEAIEPLEVERERLREALEKIAAWSAADEAKGTVAFMLYEQLTGIARAALQQEGK